VPSIPNGEGSLASPAQGTTYPASTSPQAVPEGLTIEAGTEGIHLTWNTAWDAGGYYIYRSTYDGGYTNIGTSINTAYTDSSGLRPSTYYYY
jgi:hypothetical protein